MTKTIQRLKETDSLPYIAPITTTLAPAPKPITMGLDDELARYKAMNDDLLKLNGDVAKLREERDRYRDALVAITRITTDRSAAGWAEKALNH